MFKRILNNAELSISVDKYTVGYGETFNVVFTARGEDVKPGIKVPYRILNGPSPYGSDIVLLDFSYDRDEDYYYLQATLSEDLERNILTITQVAGPPVVLEKVNATLYKYKNPLDRTEISRTFRATLEAVVGADGEKIPGVRAFDFVYSNEYGYFELDDNLSCTLTFKNKISTASPIDRVFNISLLYMPQISASTLFSSNYIPPTPYPNSPTDTKPKLKLKPSRDGITEGEEAIFVLSYENVRKNFELEYGYEDSSDKNSEAYGVVKTSEYDRVPIRIPTYIKGGEGTRLIKIWLKKYPKVSSTVFVNTYTGKEVLRYGVGTYNISFAPGASYQVELVGGGGAGGGAAKVANMSVNANTTGRNGGSTVLTVNGARFAASGGAGGIGGLSVDANTSADGVPGMPNLNTISIGTMMANILINSRGNYGSLSPSSQIGGAPLTFEGTAGANGAGGSGAKGWFYNSTKQYRVGFGGPGSSGGYIKMILTNPTPNWLTITVTVGSGGRAIESSTLGITARDGLSGENGFAILRPL